MSTWGYKPLQSDCGLDIRDGVILDHTYEIESFLRSQDTDIQEFHIPLACGAILAAVLRELGGAEHNLEDLKRWRANMDTALARIRKNGFDDHNDISECEKTMKKLFKRLEGYAADGGGFLKTYEHIRERRKAEHQKEEENLANS